VEKIIVVVPRKTGNEDLTTLLKRLFPECEIVSVSCDKEDFDAGRSTAESGLDEV
jgi:hypothetical protein